MPMCPTCDHAMRILLLNARFNFTRCQHCGTIVAIDRDKEAADWEIGQRSVFVPDLAKSIKRPVELP